MRVTGLHIGLNLQCCILNKIVPPQTFYGVNHLIPHFHNLTIKDQRSQSEPLHMKGSYLPLNLIKGKWTLVTYTLLEHRHIEQQMNQGQFIWKFQMIFHFPNLLKNFIGPLYRGLSFPFLTNLITPFMGEIFKQTQSPNSNSRSLFLLST